MKMISFRLVQSWVRLEYDLGNLRYELCITPSAKSNLSFVVLYDMSLEIKVNVYILGILLACYSQHLQLIHKTCAL